MLIICCHLSKDETKDNIRQVQETEEDDAANYDETYDELADLIESRMNMRVKMRTMNYVHYMMFINLILLL